MADIFPFWETLLSDSWGFAADTLTLWLGKERLCPLLCITVLIPVSLPGYSSFSAPSPPYPIHHLPSCPIPIFFPLKYTFFQQLSAFLTGYPFHFPHHVQVKWLESVSHTGEKIHQILFQQCWKKLLGKSCSCPTVSERTLPSTEEITGYLHLGSFYWLTQILIM